MTRCIICALVFAAISVGQTFELKDGNCTSLLSISDVKMLRYSEYFLQDIPEFQASVKNISGEDLRVGTITITATVHRTDGSKADFSFTVCPSATCEMKKDSTVTATRTVFSPVLLFNRNDFEFGGVEFTLPDSLQCPEVKRLADEAQARREAVRAAFAEAQARREAARAAAAEAQAKKDVARRKRLAAEQKKKDAELAARNAKSRAEENAKAAEERRKVRVACAVIFQNTADKKVGNLTVREDQQVRTCQALGLYPPQ